MFEQLLESLWKLSQALLLTYGSHIVAFVTGIMSTTLSFPFLSFFNSMFCEFGKFSYHQFSAIMIFSLQYNIEVSGLMSKGKQRVECESFTPWRSPS